MSKVIGRLAPSPTGAQHLGNARTYLIAWLSARSQGGQVHLRIEDIDVWRNKPKAAEQALDDLRWLGIDWDGEPVVQSTRLPQHEAALRILQERELVYPCTCSRSDISSAASAPHAEHEPPAYPGTCANRVVADASRLERPYAWRFRTSRSPGFTDRFLGNVDLNLQAIGGDFIVWRSFQVPAYQLAVVVDDSDAQVSEVIRGDDLLTSTPRQLLLYSSLNRFAPEFAHIPLVTGVDGRRLAKRHGDTRLSSLRDAGIQAELVLGLLAWSCGWLLQIRPITAKELIHRFQWTTIPPQPFVLTNELLAEIGFCQAS